MFARCVRRSGRVAGIHAVESADYGDVGDLARYLLLPGSSRAKTGASCKNVLIILENR